MRTASRRSTRSSARASARPASAAWPRRSRCSSATRDWLPDIVEKAKALKVNAGAEAGTDVGPVVSKAAKERILSLIDAGVKEGAKLELDGRDVKVSGYEQGNFVGPTIFSGVKTNMSVYTHEIFGPCWS